MPLPAVCIVEPNADDAVMKTLRCCDKLRRTNEKCLAILQDMVQEVNCAPWSSLEQVHFPRGSSVGEIIQLLDDRHQFHMSVDFIIVASNASSHESAASLASRTLRALRDTGTLFAGG